MRHKWTEIYCDLYFFFYIYLLLPHRNYSLHRMSIAETLMVVIQRHSILLLATTELRSWSTCCRMEQMCTPKTRGMALEQDYVIHHVNVVILQWIGPIAQCLFLWSLWSDRITSEGTHCWHNPTISSIHYSMELTSMPQTCGSSPLCMRLLPRANMKCVNCCWRCVCLNSDILCDTHKHTAWCRSYQTEQGQEDTPGFSYWQREWPCWSFERKCGSTWGSQKGQFAES